MNRKIPILNLFLFVPLLISSSVNETIWNLQKQKGYKISFTSSDRNNLNDYNKLILTGMKQVKSFFQSSYRNDFTVYIHPDRHSLDSTWQKIWKIPNFKSECWMVASGVGSRLDVISPKKWDKESCEHSFRETLKTQQLITHELVHVFHGQLNVSSDFSNTEGIDWFVEGLATYASGQCDSVRIAEVKKAISDHNIPESVEDFWTGKLKYALSGSLVMFIDNKYGRSSLKELLSSNKKSDILSALNTTESRLLNEWQNYFRNRQ